MVVKIRLSRWGASHNPFYGIVVSNARKARDGKAIEKVGTYNPIPDVRGIKHIELNVERIKYWLAVGAHPTERVHWLLSKIDLVPPTPKQLQGQGIHSLTDSKTWDVEVKDKDGKVLSRVSADEARGLFKGTDLEGNLPHVPTLSLPTPPIKATREHLKLDGSEPPKVPLSTDEKLYILKTFTGIH